MLAVQTDTYDLGEWFWIGIRVGQSQEEREMFKAWYKT